MAKASMTGPRVLFYDIETAHNLVAKFSLYDDGYTAHENIIAERYIICAAWSWLDEDKISTVSVVDDMQRFRKNHADDKYVVATLLEVMSQADVIVTHNGDAFDNKWVKGRALFHGLPPLPPFKSIDTLKVAKSQFKLNSNRLDYIGKILKVGQKLKTRPGLWLDVLKGDSKAVKEMVSYNKGDVNILKGVFMKFRPYMPDHVNRELYGGQANECPRCGSTHIQARGVHRAISQTYQRWQCQAEGCRGWFKTVKPQQAQRTKLRVL